MKPEEKKVADVPKILAQSQKYMEGEGWNVE